ncbi:MAG: tetratricopeptide repeat protein [Ignavibacteriae bacterium]|nr:tetratricopeptide repeat protein [Ignavibacteriota bacterium]
MIVLLTAGTVFAYWSVKDHDFSLYDDISYVVNNYYIQPGITGENLLWAMTSGYEGNWQPLTWVSHMLDIQLFGIDPAGHHLHSVLIHLLNSIVLYLLLRRMTGREGASAFVAFVFALHPLHVESVAWVCERKDLLSALFGFLAVWAYCRYVDAPRMSRYLVVIVSFAIGLMAKSIIVTLPFVLLLLDYWPLGRMALFQPVDERKHSLGYLALEKAPLFVLSVGVSIITYIVQQGVGAVKESLPMGVRLVNAVVSYLVYLRKTVLPTDLAVFYPLPSSAWPPGIVLVSCILIIAITVLAVVRIKRSPWLAVGWFWFLGTLVPMIGLVQIGAKAYADRYMYFPLVGLAIIAAWSVSEIGKTTRAVFSAKLAVAALICLALLSLTIQHVGYWENDKTLFGRALEVTERNWLAHYTLGLYAVQHHDPVAAREHFEQSIAILPSFPYAHFQLAQLLLRQGDAEASIPYFQYAVANNVEVERARLNLGIAYATVGRVTEALDQFSAAHLLNPYYGEPHKNLGLVLVQSGRYEDAERSLREAQKIAPHDTELANDIERVRQLKSAPGFR